MLRTHGRSSLLGYQSELCCILEALASLVSDSDNYANLADSCKQIDKIDMRKYNVIGSAKLVGIDRGGVHWITYYTPNSHEAPVLLQMVQQYKEDHHSHQCVYWRYECAQLGMDTLK